MQKNIRTADAQAKPPGSYKKFIHIHIHVYVYTRILLFHVFLLF